MIDEIMKALSVLSGSWKGRGVGNYPTIDPFEYDETLRFETDTGYPLIHYEQHTWLKPSGESSHWESGFIRPLEDGSIDLSNSQDSGRVEVLRGGLQRSADGADLHLVLDNVVLEHDSRLHRTRRTFTVRGEILHYVVYMATHTTPEPKLQQHLEARLKRNKD